MKLICMGLIIFSALLAIAALMFGLSGLAVLFGYTGGVATGILVGEIVAEDERK